MGSIACCMYPVAKNSSHCVCFVFFLCVFYVQTSSLYHVLVLNSTGLRIWICLVWASKQVKSAFFLYLWSTDSPPHSVAHTLVSLCQIYHSFVPCSFSNRGPTCERFTETVRSTVSQICMAAHAGFERLVSHSTLYLNKQGASWFNHSRLACPTPNYHLTA